MALELWVGLVLGLCLACGYAACPGSVVPLLPLGILRSGTTAILLGALIALKHKDGIADGH